jgi:beta-barrel assembly-enhancing protease
MVLLDDETRDGMARLALGDARLVIEDPRFRPELEALAPRFRRRAAGVTALRTLTLAAVSAVLLATLWWGTPLAAIAVAKILPTAFEERLGDAVLADMGGRRCTGAEGQKALDTLTRRLLAGQPVPYDVQVGVIDRDITNAFAAPGARIMIFNGLLQRAASPDELAGVLAHELSHALQRHPTRNLVRTLGLSLLLDLMVGGGGTLRSAGEVVLAFAYARDLEREADEGALEFLAGAGIAAEPFATFFQRLGEERAGSGLPAWLGTHPATAERIARIRSLGLNGQTAALAAEDWQALKAICAAK